MQDQNNLVPDTPQMSANLQLASNPEQFNRALVEFNDKMRKKEIARIEDFSAIQDLIMQQVKQRMLKNADEFSNKDLIALMSTMQTMIDKGMSQMTADPTLSPSVAIQQNVVNINNTGAQNLTKDQRDNVKKIIDELLGQKSNDIMNNSYVIDQEDNLNNDE